MPLTSEGVFALVIVALMLWVAVSLHRGVHGIEKVVASLDKIEEAVVDQTGVTLGLKPRDLSQEIDAG